MTVGVVGVVAALVFGVVGWILVEQTTNRLSSALHPVSDLIVDISGTVEAGQTIVGRTITALESIQSATAPSGTTLASVSSVIGSASDVVGGDLANGLEASVDTIPALVDTGRIIDRTMRALRLVGVTYDPEAPLDRSLAELEQALRPIPGQLRGQAETLEAVQTDIDRIAADADELAATLDLALTEMAEAGSVLELTAANIDRASDGIASLREELEGYELLGRIVLVAVTVALVAAASGPLLIGLRYRSA
ncbi:MAG TPA: hypothetical protein VE569_04395 [Acidimicrobiia bacterium]|jgi:methyl-accepting chemotaxis protein|nr:hypothetical protein [Acidimicrobiia bacterium]